jgi:24-methylenesterol C-methyltransferase
MCAGITINQYQVDRATHHNDRLGVAPLADVVRGNFCEMPFPANSFDAAYAIEATCHGEGSAVESQDSPV